MTAPKPPKKSETLEVRLPYQTKLAFMRRCRDDGQTASEAVRGFIETGLGRRPRARRTRLWQTLAAATAGLALGAVAAPSLARTAQTDHAAFERLDQNGDGALSIAEFERR
ncbi:MAG: hypothetical protein M3Q74_04160 [Pseudomonadota bacterium]|nr:hypothetical protein [Pseudomonadota bacterium]